MVPPTAAAQGSHSVIVSQLAEVVCRRQYLRGFRTRGWVELVMGSVYALSTVPLGLSHRIGHQLGARSDIPHGVCSAVVLPPVMDFNRPGTAARRRRVAEALGLSARDLARRRELWRPQRRCRPGGGEPRAPSTAELWSPLVRPWRCPFGTATYFGACDRPTLRSAPRRGDVCPAAQHHPVCPPGTACP